MADVPLLPESGGGKRDRTADLLHAMQALSQLSYTPTANMKLYGAGPPSAIRMPAQGLALRRRRLSSGTRFGEPRFRQHSLVAMPLDRKSVV